MKYIIVVLFIINFLGACSFKKKNNLVEENKDLITINLDNAATHEPLNYSSIFKNAGVIVLETTDASVLKRVNKIQILGESIYILDKNRGLFLFNLEGKFVKQIGSKGVGPGEYVMPADFSIDAKSGDVYILDRKPQLVLNYTADGEYAKSIKLQNHQTVSNFICFYDNRLYTDIHNLKKEGDRYLLSEIDLSTGNKSQLWLDARTHNKGWDELYSTEQDFFISNSNDYPKYKQIFMDTIYEIKEDRISPFLALQSNDLMSKEYLDNLKQTTEPFKLYPRINNSDKIVSISNYFETLDFIYFEFYRGMYGRIVIYNKKSRTTSIYEKTYDDLFYSTRNGKMLSSKFIAYDDKRVYSIALDSDYAKTIFQDLIKEDNINTSLKGFENISSLTEDSNPIIIYYEFKD